MVTTPFELSLESELDDEWLTFVNGWLFKWHALGYGGTVDVERFDGGRIHYGGIKYGHQQQQVFWQAIDRYLSQKINEIYKRWDVSTEKYPIQARLPSIDGVERSLRRFVAKIIKRSVDTDRAIRGGGYPESVLVYDSSRAENRAMGKITRLAQAHRNLLAEQERKEGPKPISFLARFAKWIEDFYANHKGLIWLGGIVASAVLGLWQYFLG